MIPDTLMTPDSCVGHDITTPQLCFAAATIALVGLIGTWAFATIMDKQREASLCR